MGPRCCLQTAHSLQLLLVHGDTPFTPHSAICQTCCTSGAAEAHSPDIIRATLFLRCVSERCFGRCMQQLFIKYADAVCSAPFQVSVHDIVYFGLLSKLLCVVFHLTSFFSYNFIDFSLKKKKNYEMSICWITIHTHQTNCHIITSYYTPFPYLLAIVTLFNMTERRIIMLEETDRTLCWMFLQVQRVVPPSAFGVKFHKCARVRQHDCLNSAHLIWYPIYFWTVNEHFKDPPAVNTLLNHTVPRWSLTLILLSWHSFCWFTTWAQWVAVAPTCLRWLSGTPSLE